MAAILLIDDEKNIRDFSAIVLKKSGHTVVAVEGAATAMEALAKTSFDLLLLDFMMPTMDGLNFLEHCLTSDISLPPVVFMTAFGSVDTAVSALRSGASDYLAKPFTTDELLHIVSRNLQTQKLVKKVTYLEQQVPGSRIKTTTDLPSENRAMQAVVQLARQAAASFAPILIEGETGTGKERLAHFIHHASSRSNQAFVAVNCGALHPELLLSELFGHKRGAFTGAVEDRLGKFEAANGGTLFLDEVGELEPAAQVKLLRVLQEGTFERVGDLRTYYTNVRIIAATNRRLDNMVTAQTFRSDLYYRLAVITLRLPALRERTEDIPGLASEITNELASELGRSSVRISPDDLQLLMSHPWTGNIRELRNCIQRALIFTPPQEELLQVKDALAPAPKASGGISDAFRDMATEAWTLEEVEKGYLSALLSRSELKAVDVCAILQIDASTLWRRRKKYGI